jgi:DNA-binding transcriptional ArsR family regulator
MTHPNIIPRISELFGAMADPTRAYILLLLLEGEKRSGDLGASLEITHSAVSHQLRWLRDRRIVTSRKERREVYYALADDCIREIIQVALKHLSEGIL